MSTSNPVVADQTDQGELLPRTATARADGHAWCMSGENGGSAYGSRRVDLLALDGPRTGLRHTGVATAGKRLAGWQGAVVPVTAAGLQP